MIRSALGVFAAEPGVPGELICKEAFPIQPLGFWPLPGYGFGQEDVQKAQERFGESYFKDDQGMWCELTILFISHADASGKITETSENDLTFPPVSA
jgi:hypothetical protein